MRQFSERQEPSLTVPKQMAAQLGERISSVIGVAPGVLQQNAGNGHCLGLFHTGGNVDVVSATAPVVLTHNEAENERDG